MKIFKQLLIVTLIFFVFSGCQKELNFDGAISIGSLKSAVTGDCNPITITGVYQEDSALTSANYVDVQVNVSVGGSFEVKSDTVNGFSFYKAGTVPAGLSTIRLYPSGKPDTALLTTFTVMYDSTFCTFSINVVPSTVGGAVYTLGGSPNNCSGFNVFGNYNAGQATNAGDSVTFLVSVTTPGTYSITTGPTAINGMKFSATGMFPNTGTQSVTLHGSGTPVAAGSNTFSPTGGGTTCNFSITTLPAGTGTAVFTFDGGPAPGTCSGAILGGSYAAGTATNPTSNYVDVFVTVTTVGTYSITASADGITFGKTGTFTSTTPAPQIVRLAATGTPSSGGSFNFTPTAGTSSCVFTVIVSGVANPDYIPETVGSNWTDSLVGGTPADTSYVQVSPNTIVKGLPPQTYRIFEVKDMGTPTDSFFHRKNGGLYYQYFVNDPFGFFDLPINKDVLILDSTKAVNGTWTVDFGPNTALGGILVFLDVKFDAKILAKGSTATIAGNSYSNVIKVKFTYSGDIGGGPMVFAEEEFWYAKGLGLIYDKQNDVPVTTTIEYVTKRIQIF